jgi:hypothetical protein
MLSLVYVHLYARVSHDAEATPFEFGVLIKLPNKL